MNTYSPEMYNEIVEYHNFRYGKFSEIPYPNLIDIEKELKQLNVNQKR